MWGMFPVLREFVNGAAASSVDEADEDQRGHRVARRRLGDRRLAAHGVDTDEKAFQIQRLEQFGHRRNLVALLVDDDLAEADGIGRRPGSAARDR